MHIIKVNTLLQTHIQHSAKNITRKRSCFYIMSSAAGNDSKLVEIMLMLSRGTYSRVGVWLTILSLRIPINRAVSYNIAICSNIAIRHSAIQLGHDL